MIRIFVEFSGRGGHDLQENLLHERGYLRSLEIFKRCRTGNNFIVALGVVVLAIVFAIMLVNWAKPIFNQSDSSMMVFILLIIFNLVGVLSIGGLSMSRKNETTNDRMNGKKMTFF
ncbi:uncharacterized protein LOC134266334 [Saccostrea cucullata]|uniref:uncharacterized protein LOC134266334 n=1 Tax=Saccostrea cuccullata TaxID=36930 RepID=UPI002ED4F12D